MPYSHDLLEQAKFLVGREKGKPKQASLRRAISSAYYAVFHLLSAEAASQASPATPAGLSIRIQRTLEHTAMKEAARSFESGNISASLKPMVRLPLPAALISVARSFSQLQEERHTADYDLSKRLDRAQAQNAVARADQLFIDWMTVRTTDEARVFLIALLLYKQLKR